MGKRFYKFKAWPSLDLGTCAHFEKDRQRVIDIVKNNRLYMPPYEKLNDPFEGNVFATSLINEDPSIEALLEQTAFDKRLHEQLRDFRVLSFSQGDSRGGISTEWSQLMWSHYAEGHTGICFGFTFSDDEIEIESVDYDKPLTSKMADHFVKNDVRRLFKYKNKVWKYENERRVIREKSETDNDYVEIEIKEVIVGYRMSKADKKFWYEQAKKKGIDISIAVINHSSPSKMDKTKDKTRILGNRLPDFGK